MALVTSTAALEMNGFVLIPGFAAPKIVAELRAAVTAISGRGDRAGIRDLLRVSPSVAAFASSLKVLNQLTPFTKARPFAVRGILFDKTPDTNWLVAWHQDLTIAIREQRDVPGFGPWSVKAAIPHVQPPPALLARMITVRLHLDDCDASNGALRVLPGSHRHGKLSAAEIAEWRTRTSEQVCSAHPGDALLMRPLLLHASSLAEVPNCRRVIHIEFTSEELPGGLEWFERVGA